jgi:hypothetical protein
MLVQNSGPHVVQHLQSRVDSLKAALDAAQDRINELERVFGGDDDLMPLVRLGLTKSEARIVHLVRSRECVTGEQIEMAMYADNPDHAHDVDGRNVMKVHCTRARQALAKFGVTFQSVGYGSGSSGYRMTAADKARLAKLIASGARLVTRGRPDRKHYKRVSRGEESRAMHG